MSYILDAIRKSDQQRRRGAAPTLQSAPFAEVADEPRSRWIYPALALALAIAGFALGWMRPWHGAARPALQKSTELAASAPAFHALPAAEPEALRKLPASRAPSHASMPSQATAKRSPPAALPPAPPVPAQQPAPAAPAAAEKPVPYAELPVALRQELPPMRVSVHAYARTPGERLVDVNDKLLHEGDTLAPGLVLEAITPQGMVFNYKGTRFSRGVQ